MSISATEREKKEIQYLLKVVEKQLGWGDINSWKNRHYQQFIDSIEKKTKQKVSISTVKRISGKIPNSFLPNTSTLNTISQYLDYEDWKDFIIKNKENIDNGIIKATKKTILLTKRKVFKFIIFLILTAFIVFTPQIYRNYRISQIDPLSINFECVNPQSKAPHEVIFNYDLKIIPYNKHVTLHYHIQDIEHDVINISKKGLDKRNFIYKIQMPIYSSFHLKIHGRTVKKFYVLSETNGFQLYAEPIKDIRYATLVPEDSLKNNGVLTVTQDQLEKWNIYNEKMFPYFILVDAKLSQNVNPDKFSVSFDIKNPVLSGSRDNCALTFVSFLGIDNYISFGMSNIGCSSNNKIYLPGLSISGETSDLSNFTLDMNQWNKVQVINNNNLLHIYFNGKLAFSQKLTQALDKFTGIKIRIIGYGMIDNVQISDIENQEPVYSNDFSE